MINNNDALRKVHGFCVIPAKRMNPLISGSSGFRPSDVFFPFAGSITNGSQQNRLH